MFRIFIIIFLFTCLFLTFSNDDYALSDYLPQTALEKTIIKSINEGQCVDMMKSGQFYTKPVLNAKFLSSLLKGRIHGLHPKNTGIYLSNFKVVGDLNVPYLRCNHIIRFENMEFTHKVKLSGHFEELLSFAGSTFNGQFILNNTVLRQDLNLEGTKFLAQAFFAQLRIDGSIYAESVNFLDKNSTADFSKVNISQFADFKSAVFAGPVNFSFMSVHGPVSFNRSVFANRLGLADFTHIRISQSLLMRDVIFHGPMHMKWARIGGSLALTNAKFLNEHCKYDFAAIQVDQVLSLKEARFYGQVRFTAAKVSGNLEMNRAKFFDYSKKVSFNGVNVGRYILMNRIEASSLIDFTGSIIGKNLEAKDSSFKDKELSIKFTGIKVQRHILLNRSKFSGPLEGGNIHIGGKLSFLDATLNTDVNISRGKMEDLRIEARNEKRPLILRNLDLSGSEIFRKMIISRATIEKILAPSLKVHGESKIFDINITKELDLRHASFNRLNLNFNDKFAPSEDSNKLQGLKFESISYENQEKIDSPKDILTLLSTVKFSRGIYTQLIAYYKERGESGAAKQVLFDQKKREGGLWNWFLRWTVGHGKEPWRAFLVAGGFWVAGFVIFWKRTSVMLNISENKVKSIPWYNRFFFSLDLIIPIVDLQMIKHWTPIKPWKNIYARIQIIFGWLLIPIGTAAISGLIK